MAVDRARALLRLVRWENCSALAATTLVGAHLGGAALGPRGLLAAGCVVALHGGGTALNDRCDVDVDRLARPDRPLPSGELSLRTAERVWFGLTATGLLLATSLGAALAAVAGVVAAASIAYAVRLKSTVLAGNLVVAGLCAATVPFGAAAASSDGRPPVAAMAAAALVGLYMLVYEILKCAQDVEPDGAAGVRTIATAWGTSTAHRVALALLTTFGCVALVPVLLGGFRGYAVAVVLPLACAAATVVCLLRLKPPAQALQHGLGWLKLGWFLAVPALLLLP